MRIVTYEGRMGAKGGSESFETTMQVCDPFKKSLKGELGRKSLRLQCSSGDVWASNRELWYKDCWLRSHTLGRNVQVLVSAVLSHWLEPDLSSYTAVDLFCFVYFLIKIVMILLFYKVNNTEFDINFREPGDTTF